MGKDAKEWEHLRVNLGFGYSGSSLPSWLSLSSANLLIRKIFFSMYTWRRHGFVSIMAVSFGLPTKRCQVLKTQQDVSWWETTSILLTHTRKLSCHVQAHTALAGNTQHPNGDGSLLRGSDEPLSPTCQGTTAKSFPRFKKLNIIYNR